MASHTLQTCSENLSKKSVEMPNIRQEKVPQGEKARRIFRPFQDKNRASGAPPWVSLNAQAAMAKRRRSMC